MRGTGSDDGGLGSGDPSDLGQDATARELRAAALERWLDIPMAILAAVWVALVAYELVAPREQLDGLTIASNVIWVVFASLAATLGAFFTESRQERAVAEITGGSPAQAMPSGMCPPHGVTPS